MRRLALPGRGTVALFLVMMLCCGASGQAPNSFRTAPAPRLVVEPDRRDLQTLKEAQQAIGKKQYLTAAQGLQRILDLPEDSFREEDFAEGRGSVGGIRQEALLTLLSMPADGIAAYELEYGAAARQLLDTAKAADDDDSLAEVVRRYTATAAGMEASIHLAALAADRNRPLEAALLLEPLRNHPKRTPQIGLQRAAYWYRAGRTERAVASIKSLKRSIPSGKVTIAGADVSLPTDEDETKTWLAQYASRVVEQGPGLTAWPIPGGDPARNAAAASTSPVGGSIWHASTFEHLTIDGRPEEDRRHRTTFQDSLQRIQQTLLEENRPALPAALPLVIGDTVIYRTIGDVTAISLQTGELRWRSSLVDESLVRLINGRSIDARLRSMRSATIDAHLERRIYRDTAVGTLSSDGQSVFAIEELDTSGSFRMNALGIPTESRAVNKLVAYELSGGRIKWEVGGPRGSVPVNLAAQFFLGPPLPVDDYLYVISEDQGALVLLALKQDEDRATVELDWHQTLIATDQPVTSHLLRRLSGLSPSLSDGVLVCPSSSGGVVAVDVARRTLLWGFQYPSMVRPSPQNGMQVFRGPTQADFQIDEADKFQHWMDSTPLIANGKVLITPRDSNQLFCLDLVDGHELWHMDRGEGLYVAAVVDGQVVIVRRHGVEAVDLNQGTPTASFVESQVEPTGRGIRVGTSYFLPTTTGEIATIDLRTGHIFARSKLGGGLIPGNLAAGGGALVSLSAGDVVGFSRLELIEHKVAEDLKANPRNPRALALRGELRLHRGEQEPGLADLRESLKQKPDAHVKGVLAAALLAKLRSEPQRVRDYADELDAVTDDPQQKNEYLRLYSQTLEAAGDRRGAFVQMIRLAQTAQFLDDLEPVEAGYSVRTARSIRARLIAMYAAASPEEKAEMDRAIEQHIRNVPDGTEPLQHLGRCLRFVGGLPRAEALLLERTIEADGQNGQNAHELLNSFLRSSEPTIVAQATAVLCSKLLKGEQWSEAATLIRRLRTEFSDQVCLNGKTGRSLAEEWSTKDPLRPFLSNTSPWPTGAIDPKRGQRPPNAELPNVPAEVVSISGSILAGWSFETDATGAFLMARDASGTYRWKLPIPGELEAVDIDFRTPEYCQIHIRDNWLVVARPSHFVVVDASSTLVPRMVWQQPLRTAAELAQQQALAARRANFNMRTGSLPSGRVMGITRETVIYAVGSKLRAAELETGRLAWTRQDVVSGQINGSADDHAVSVTSNVLTLVRTLDGAKLGVRPLLHGTVWNRGSRALVYQSKGDQSHFEMRDIVGNTLVWTRDFAADTLATVVDDDVAFLEPSGQFTMARLSDGVDRYRSDLPLKAGPREQSWFTVQRCPDRDIVMGGKSYLNRAVSQVLPFVATASRASAFEGFVCSVSPADGKLQWATPVEKAAFDRSQPASLPVLLLATRQVEPRNFGNPFDQGIRMNVTLLDKRTGALVYATEETSISMPPRFEPQPDRNRIVANFHEWQLQLTFTDAEPPKP
jgi:outer membrane protein assembly factor BamB